MEEVVTDETHLAKKSGTETRIILKQVLLASGPLSVNLIRGMANGYSATLLPSLKQDDNFRNINLDEETWIASSLVPALAIGSIAGGYFTEKIGRKAALIWTSLGLSATWLLISYSPNVPTLCAGRFLFGLVVGLSGPASTLFLGETILPKYRGFLQTTMMVGIASGILIVHIISTFTTWKVTAMISVVFPFFCCIPLCLVPETPDWLVRKKKIEKAGKALQWIRGSPDGAKDIVDNLNLNNTNTKRSSRSLKEILMKPEFIKPLLIVSFCFAISQFSGHNFIGYYAVDIVKKSIGSGLDEYVSVIIIDLIRILAAIIGVIVSKFLPSRTITFISGYGCSLSIFGLALSIHYSEWLPPALRFVFVLSFVFLVTGLVPIPWNMNGVMFPPNYRGLGSGISQGILFLSFFLVVKTGPYLFKSIGQVATYCIYGSSTFLGTTVLYFVMPEIYGKTLEEIQDTFKKKDTEPEKTEDSLI